jgi:two-component system, cell cycle sensor histidine kinase and response regulator CckA
MPQLNTVVSGNQSAGSSARPATFAPARILIVDDDTSVREFVDQVCREAGYTTVRAIDGQDALEMAEQMGSFDLLLTDELMPRMQGHELARRLRKREPNLKVLYLTGYSDVLFQEKLVLWEHEAFLDKPSTADALLEAVSQLLNTPMTLD